MAADRSASESMVPSPESLVIADLKSADIETLSPLQAFDLLLRLKQHLSEQKPD
jgi:hypothetical protein